MPIFRSRDGTVEKISEKGGDKGKKDQTTRKVQRRSTAGGEEVAASGDIRPQAAAPTPGTADGDTVPVNRKGAAKAAGESGTEPKTRVFHKGAKEGASDAGAQETSSSVPQDAMDDPPVGWLVIVEGPGKGNAEALGYGANQIGRGKNQRVCLDFGDKQISRDGHAVVTCDPRSRKFYVQHGGGKNLTYYNDAPVLAPAELQDRGEIIIGGTKLMFVALCGDQFDWQDT